MRGGSLIPVIGKGSIKMNTHRFSFVFSLFIVLAACSFQSCKKPGNAKSAFYYWKSSFSLDTKQTDLLKTAANNTLYIRFFDVRWDNLRHEPFPDAVINFKQPVSNLHITPVIFMTNKSFENISGNDVDSLAVHCNTLVNQIAAKQNISYSQIQVDCDWTTTTRERYFDFLRSFRKLNRRHLEATVRLHQVKYKERTGVPPVDKGILMFYNMGRVSADPKQPNSIYNEIDAEKYVAHVSRYPLPLDVALPLFSWSVHIREGKVIQLYGQLGKKQLDNKQNFEQDDSIYHAKKSFFLDGIYIKESDIFKLEQMDEATVKKAADQLSRYLPKQQNRTIIYYELGNLNLSEFKAETLGKISADL